MLILQATPKCKDTGHHYQQVKHLHVIGRYMKNEIQHLSN